MLRLRDAASNDVVQNILTLYEKEIDPLPITQLEKIIKLKDICHKAETMLTALKKSGRQFDYDLDGLVD